MTTSNSPDMFAELTREELLALTIKMDRAAETGSGVGYDQAVTTEIYDVQADLYDARARASYANGGTIRPEPGTGEYAYEVLMSQAERQEHDRQLQAAAEDRAAAAEARLARLEHDAATSGRDIFGRPLAPEAPRAEAEAEAEI